MRNCEIRNCDNFTAHISIMALSLSVKYNLILQDLHITRNKREFFYGRFVTESNIRVIFTNVYTCIDIDTNNSFIKEVSFETCGYLICP